MNDDDPFLTPAEIARDLRVSKMTVFRLLNTGAIPSIRAGRQFRIRQSAYLQYLNQKEN
jgi:excisionase family DNA binding protein